MYIDNSIKSIKITWTAIVRHEYVRVSRAKWRIDLSYACGAEMSLEDQPDDLIQCLVVGAFNSGKTIQTNLGELSMEIGTFERPLSEWKELQPLIVES